jgi:lipopolysaccharide/colanic/teichoic acid biosynthesis glycosyltransferase
MRTLEDGIRHSRGPAKRALDLVVSVTALVVGAPLLSVVALCVLASMGRPILFVQERIGRDRVPFLLYKFRTMRHEMHGPQITAAGDGKITRLGAFLRRTKLDELPQLVNVLLGDMSLVGPRPEVPRYVALYTPDQARLLEVRPGLTDPATVQFRDEEILLGGVGEGEREEFYVRSLMPRKLALSREYLEQRAGLVQDVLLLARTAGALLGLFR